MTTTEETVAVTFTRHEWETLTRAAWLGAYNVSNQVREYEEHNYPEMAARQAQLAQELWAMVSAVTLALKD
jgi:hypothetical protein